MDEFTFGITTDLRRISNDNHITVVPPHSRSFDLPNQSIEYEAMTSKELKKQIEKNKKKEEKYRQSLKENMFDYGEIKILPQNIGYVEIKNFNTASIVKSKNRHRITIAAMFQCLRKTNSLIIDLRENNGGLTNMAVKFCSYFSNQPNTYFITEESFFRYDSNGIGREFSVKKSFYTDAQTTNSLTKGKNIYILISSRTFSAAELSVYKIKQFVPTATVVGEQTKGGGNGYSGTQIGKYYTAIIPSSKAYDESDANYNIEGRGITPDIFCVSDSALQVAYRLASNDNLDTAKQEVKYFTPNKLSIDKPLFEKYYPDYVGDYRKISVYVNKGRLYMCYDRFKKCLLLPTDKDFFQADGFDLVQFKRDNGSNLVIAIVIKHTDGYLESFRKQ
ncbi:MAG: S41 family peptidase [Chitinophagaceae bacterium]